METKLLTPVEVVRDSEGYWTHPILKSYFDPELEQWDFSMYPLHNEYEVKQIYIDDDYYAPHGLVLALDDGDCNVSEWKPTPPDGEVWFLVWIAYSEDGPFALFIRQKE